MLLNSRQTVVTGLPACGCLCSRLPARPSHRQLFARTPDPPTVQRRCSAATRPIVRHAACIVASSKSQTASVFPAGKKQARVKLPACILSVSAQDVLQQETFDQLLSQAVAGGITAVLLTDTSGSDGAALYEAAGKLKGQLRGRAVLLVADRTDIADAAEADGVVLSSKGTANSLL